MLAFMMRARFGGHRLSVADGEYLSFFFKDCFCSLKDLGRLGLSVGNSYLLYINTSCVENLCCGVFLTLITRDRLSISFVVEEAEVKHILGLAEVPRQRRKLPMLLNTSLHK